MLKSIGFNYHKTILRKIVIVNRNKNQTAESIRCIGMNRQMRSTFRRKKSNCGAASRTQNREIIVFNDTYMAGNVFAQNENGATSME